MSPFLNDVRVFDVFAQGGKTSFFKVQNASSPDDGSSSHSEQPAPAATPKPKHHSDGDNDFLAVPICAIVFTFIYLIIKTVMAPFTQRAKSGHNPFPPPGSRGGLSDEETAVLQKLQRTLSQMESRVEALETILIEQARTEKKYGSKL